MGHWVAPFFAGVGRPFLWVGYAYKFALGEWDSYMAFTYNVADLSADSAVGRRSRVRLLIADSVNTSDQPAIFDDAEVDAFLSLGADDIYEAGAMAFETWARSRSRVAKYMQQSGTSTQRQAILDLLAAAQNLRDTPLKLEAAGGIQTGEVTSGAGEYLDETKAVWITADGLAANPSGALLSAEDETILLQG